MASLAKFQMCVINTQFGKTFETLADMRKAYQLDDGNNSVVTVIFTMNTLLNNAQFTSRLSELADLIGLDEIAIIASQTRTQLPTYKTEGDLLTHLLRGHRCPKVIVCCSNNVRFEGMIGVVLFLTMHGNDKFTQHRKINIVFDELHYYINQGSLRSKIEALNEVPNIGQITGLTATPSTIWSTHVTNPWYTVQLRPLDFNDAGYYYMKSMQWVDVSQAEALHDPDVPQYAYEVINTVRNSKESILSTYKYMRYCIKYIGSDKMFAGGSRVFLPAHKNRKSHNLTKQLVWEFEPNSCIVVINGTEKALYYLDGDEERIVHLEEHQTSEQGNLSELCDNVHMALTTRGLLTRSLAFIGRRCLEMGQTLAHRGYGNFDYGIIAPDTDFSNNDLYQTGGRLTARCLNWSTFRPTTILTTSHYHEALVGMEERATVTAQEFSSVASRCITLEEYEAATDLNIIVKPLALPGSRQKGENNRSGDITYVAPLKLKLDLTDESIQALIKIHRDCPRLRGDSRNQFNDMFRQAFTDGKIQIVMPEGQTPPTNTPLHVPYILDTARKYKTTCRDKMNYRFASYEKNWQQGKPFANEIGKIEKGHYDLLVPLDVYETSQICVQPHTWYLGYRTL